MEVPGTVQGEAYEKMFLFEKGELCFVEDKAVGLEGVGDRDSRSGQGSGFPDKLLEPVKPCQGGLSSLKDDVDGVARF